MHSAVQCHIHCATDKKGGVFVKVRISPAAALLLLLAARQGALRLFSVVLAAAFHEAGHLLAAAFLSLPVKKLELDLFGAKIYTAPLPSYRAEAALCLAGPLFSLFLGFALLPFKAPFFHTVAALSFSFALFNLLPVAGLDGGRVLAAFLSLHLGPARSDRVLSALSYLSLLFLFSLAAALLLRYGQDALLSLLCAALFARQFLKAA